MTDTEPRMNFTEDQLVALLAEHYELLSPPAGFEHSLLAEVESEFRRLHSRVRRPLRWNIFRRIPRPRLAIPAAVVTVVVVLAILALFPSRDVLAQTAERLKGVRTIHFEMTFPGNSDVPLSECWSQGDRTYCHVRVKDGIFAEEWMDSKRWVLYSKDSKRVVIKEPDPGLMQAFSGLQVLHDFKPADWKTFPQQTISEGGSRWLVVEMPGTGKFNGTGTSGDTRMRLWVDEKTALPGKLEGLLRSAPGVEWKSFVNFRFIWDATEQPDSLFEPKYPPDAYVAEIRSEKEPKIAAADAETVLAAGGVLVQTAERMKDARTLHFEITAPSLDAQVTIEIWSRGDKIYCSMRKKDRVLNEEWASSAGFVAYLRDENRVIISTSEPGLQVRSIAQWVNDFNASDWKLLGQEAASEGGLKWLVLEMHGTGKITGLRTTGDTRSRLWIDEKTALPGKLEVQQHSSGTDWATFTVVRFLWDNPTAPESFFEPKYPADAKVTDERRHP